MQLLMRTPINTHTRIHNHTGTQDCIHAHTYTYTHVYACNHTHMHTVREAGTCAGIHACMQVMASWHTDTYMNASVHPCIQAHMHAQCHTRMRSGMNGTMHAYTNAPTHSMEYNMHAFPCVCVGGQHSRNACMHAYTHAFMQSHTHMRAWQTAYIAMHTSGNHTQINTHTPHTYTGRDTCIMTHKQTHTYTL